MLQLGAILMSRYRIERELSRGGMGVIYEATQLDLQRRVAIKTLLHDDPEALKRFGLEALAAARINHPNVVSIYDCFPGDQSTPPFLVMEMLFGSTLTATVEIRGGLSDERLMQLAQHLGRALAAIHAAGLVHRDVKPDNVWVSGGQPIVDKLIDFGIVRELSQKGVTETGCAVGTLRYMAPEILAGLRGDARSDLFSLGATLLFAATGEKPNPGERLLDRAKKLPPSPFSNAIVRVLAEKPADRFASAPEFVAALEAGQLVQHARILNLQPPYRGSEPTASTRVGLASPTLAAIPVLRWAAPLGLTAAFVLALVGGLFGARALLHPYASAARPTGVAAPTSHDEPNATVPVLYPVQSTSVALPAEGVPLGTAALLPQRSANTPPRATGAPVPALRNETKPVASLDPRPNATSTLPTTRCRASSDCGMNESCQNDGTCKCAMASKGVFFSDHCGGSCQSIESHEQCGSCGHACSTSEICAFESTSGRERPLCKRCGVGELRCGNRCRTTKDLQTDARNCGRCNNECNGFTRCEGGVCIDIPKNGPI